MNGLIRSPSRQRAQCRWLGWCAQAGRCGLTHLFPHACNTGADQGLVADELEGEADQDRREGGEPRTLRRLPNGGGRHPTTNVPGDSTADRGTTAATTTRASMKRLNSVSNSCKVT